MQIQELGHVVLYVTNITRMADFYRDILGFPEIARDAHTALFSGGRTHHELLLIQIGGQPNTERHRGPGLYHIGFKIGDGSLVIREALDHLEEHGVAIIGTADHTVTHSLYILDPDGNELELYADVSDEWKTNPSVILNPVKPLVL
jgi:catechol 2,3-dioxygenase